MTEPRTPADDLDNDAIAKLARALTDDQARQAERQWTVADLAGKTPAEIEQARRDGKLTDVMTGKAPDSTEYRHDHISTVRKAQ